MPTSGPGSPEPTQCGSQRGFTLLELMVVITLIALATVGTAMALRDSAQQALERDAVKLAAWLTAAHAQARSSGVPVPWQAVPGGVQLSGTVHRWDHEGTRLDPPQGVIDPEPLLPPLQLVVSDAGHQVGVATDGIRPFQVQPGGRAPAVMGEP